MPQSTDNKDRTAWPRLAAIVVVVVFGLVLLAVADVTVFLGIKRSHSNSRDAVTTSDTNGLAAKSLDDGRMSVAPMPLSRQQQERLSQVTRELNPKTNGWQTEAFSDAAQDRLNQLGQLIERIALADRIKDDEIDSQLRCESLRPLSLVESFPDATTAVRRLDTRIPAKATSSSAGDFLSAVRNLPGMSATGSPATADYHVKLKITSVDLKPTSANTVVIAEGYGAADGHRIQWNANWSCDWSLAESTMPRLSAIRLSEYEEVESLAGPSPWLQDHTVQILGAAGGYQDQLAFGMDRWLTRLAGRLNISRLGHNGIAIGDVNGDGREDVYVCQSGGLPNRLYLHQNDGTVREVSEEAGVDFLDDTTCALLVDLDNDGDQDLTLATISGGLVLSNDGEGHFTQRAYLPECQNAFSLTAADYNQDRLLDLYVGRYWPSVETRGEIPIPVPYYDGQNGGRNVLLHNAGGWKFDDRTAAVGLDKDNTRYTMAAAWEDIDDDGDIDLYVANDFGKNCLYLSDGGRFHNVAQEAGVEDIASGMSVSFADFDRDDHVDIYVSNMFSSAGNRIAYQRIYEDRFDAEGTAHFRRMARGNSLFRNLGNRTFHDVSVASGTTMGRWAWGSIFADINNDGWEDLLVMNGNLTAEKPGDL